MLERIVRTYSGAIAGEYLERSDQIQGVLKTECKEGCTFNFRYETNIPTSSWARLSKMVHNINLNIRILLQWIKKHANMNLSSHLKKP
jgi:hypothetical protein